MNTNRREQKRLPSIKLHHLIGHFLTVTRHRHLVMRYCFRMGLYRQGLLHDLSKYSPTEFWRGVRFFQGNRSPNVPERDMFGYSEAWLHHKGRNKHHIEYWIEFSRKAENPYGIRFIRMPKRYVAEMVADRVAASRIYRGKEYTQHDPLKYYAFEREKISYHPATMRQLEFFLRMIDRYGEDWTFRYIRLQFLGGRRGKRQKSLRGRRVS